MAANQKAVEIALNYIKRKSEGKEPNDMSVLDSMEKKAKSTIVNKNAVPIGFKSAPAQKPAVVGSTGTVSNNTPANTPVSPPVVGTPKPTAPEPAKPVTMGGRRGITIVSKTKPAEPAATPAPTTEQPVNNAQPVPVESPVEKPKPAQSITVMQPSAHYVPPINKGMPTAAPYAGQAAPYKPPTPIVTKVDHKKVEIPVTQSQGLPKRDSNEVAAIPSQAKLPTTSGDKKVMKEQIERGTAAWINDEDVNPNKYYALHKKAPIGTIIKVTNIGNGQSIFVKVVGTLPETAENASLIIKISKSASKKLVVMEPKFQAELSYGMPQ